MLLVKIFCSGIGGIGLSAYAALQKQAGHDVSGSDRTKSVITEDLEKQGITVSLIQDGSALPDDCELFVYSEAIPKDAPERKRAEQLGVKQQSYFQALGELSSGTPMVIAVCGTHGKSSTTAMAAKVLTDAGLDPTVVVGTRVPDLDNKNWRKGAGKIFLLEACEYRRSFHHLSPTIVLMTNVDGDHFDAFPGGLEEYQQAYADFLQSLPKDGPVIAHGCDADSRRLVEGSVRELIDADDEPLAKLQVPGLHMQQNAQLVLALASKLGIAEESALKSLAAYRGSWRRMEVKGTTKQGALVIDDYGHHPKEIAATLAALKGAYEDRRIICVFQPHTHDRILKLYDDFVQSFRDANIVVVPNIYDARHDIETTTVDVDAFIQDIQEKSNVEVHNGESLQVTEAWLHEMLQPEDVLLCLGAGDITNLATAMVTASVHQ